MARDVPLTNIYNMSTNNWTHVLAKDEQESEDNKSYIICDNIFTKTTNDWQIHLWKKITGGVDASPSTEVCN